MHFKTPVQNTKTIWRLDMSDRYILNGHDAVEEPDLIKWAQWFQIANRTVRKEPVGNVDVYTMFLGLDYSFGGGKPLLFETMVFGGPLDQECDRCSTWEAAEQMHEKMCDRVKLAANELYNASLTGVALN